MVIDRVDPSGPVQTIEGCVGQTIAQLNAVYGMRKELLTVF